jgi:flagellar biosynthesis/type III secretory pathway protein FliH
MDAIVGSYGKQRTTSKAHLEITALVYPAVPGKHDATSISNAMQETIAADVLSIQCAGEPQTGSGEDGMQAEFERRISEESTRHFEAGRKHGYQEGVKAEREAQAGVLSALEKQRTAQLAALMQRFDEERERYLHAVEQEVVQLALSIAARVLRREAQMDPLLLTGAVRVALGQLSNATHVSLRVPSAELDLWVEAIEHLPNLSVKPAVLAVEDMQTGDCVLESELGSVDLGIRSQLIEIERGFFDSAHRSDISSTDKSQANYLSQREDR